MSNDSKRREYDAALRVAVEEAERHPYQVELHKQRRVERKLSAADNLTLSEWVRVKEIVLAWASDRKLTFDEARLEVGNRIVIDSAEGRLGTEHSPDLMLLSVEYDKYKENDDSNKRGFSPLALENTIRIAFGDLAPDIKAQKVAEFLTAHSWLKRTVATKWFPEFRLPSKRQQQAAYYELPANEPARGRAPAMAYHALKERYGMQVPKLPLQQIANNLPGNHSRDAIARALDKKK